MDGQLIELNAADAMERVALLLGELAPAGQLALAADLERWRERWQTWLTVTSSWDCRPPPVTDLRLDSATAKVTWSH